MEARKLMLWVGMVLGVVVVTASHTLHMGRSCPKVLPFPNLSIDKVLGVWYVIYKFDTSNTCLVWNITKVAEEEYSVTESRQLWLLDSVNFDHQHHITGRLDVPNPEVPARMRIRWPTSLTGKADFIIFDTDYTNYMAVFECDRAGFVHRRSVAVLSRASVMDQTFVDRIRRLLDSAGVSHQYLDNIDHNTCRERGRYSWHTEGELFGLFDPAGSRSQQQQLSKGIVDYDLTQLEIIGDGVMEDADGNPFKGSINKPKSF